jgi:hypothetical protein
MRKYFTRRCMGLHALTLVLVPAFLAAGWWQYRVALSGNDLSWVYTVEWPFFAVYAVYIWWKLIHDERTPFDRLWAAKQRAAADESGTPLHQIPGWATDKALSRAVTQASVEAARLPALSSARVPALGRPGQKPSGPVGMGPSGTGPLDGGGDALAAMASPPEPDHGGGCPDGPVGSVIDARVVEVKVVVDEELEAYNRYLAELSWLDPPKRWGASRGRRQHHAPGSGDGRAPAPAVRQPPELPPGDDGTPG